MQGRVLQKLYWRQELSAMQHVCIHFTDDFNYSVAAVFCSQHVWVCPHYRQTSQCSLHCWCSKPPPPAAVCVTSDRQMKGWHHHVKPTFLRWGTLLRQTKGWRHHVKPMFLRWGTLLRQTKGWRHHVKPTFFLLIKTKMWLEFGGWKVKVVVVKSIISHNSTACHLICFK